MEASTKDKKDRVDDGRATIGLSKETVDRLDMLRKRTAEAVKETSGIAVSPTRAQIVASLVQSASEQ